MTNREKLQDLLLDVFLLDPSEFSFDLKREEIQTWDSMGVVADEATSVTGVDDIIRILESKGISFAE